METDMEELLHAFASIPPEENNPLNFRVVEQPILSGSNQKESVGLLRYKSLVREDDGTPLAVVRDTYGVVQHSELFECADKAIRKTLSPTMEHRVKQNSSFHGRVGVYTFDFAYKESQTGLEKLPPLHLRFVLLNSFGLSAIHFFAFAIDSICLNGFIFEKYAVSGQQKHTRNISMNRLQKRFEILMKGALTGYGHLAETYDRWDKTPVTDKAVKGFLADLPVSQTKRRGLAAQFEKEVNKRGKTLWALVSAMSYYSSHNSDEFPVSEAKKDCEAHIILGRQKDVYNWMHHPAFYELEKAA